MFVQNDLKADIKKWEEIAKSQQLSLDNMEVEKESIFKKHAL